MHFNQILIIAATGKTGLQVTKEALKRGYKVKVLVRDSTKLNQLGSKVEIIQGDATNSSDVLRAVKGTQAVTSTIGPTKTSPAGMQPQAAQNIVEAMQAQSVNRLISMTGAGVRTDGDNPKFVDKAILALMKIVAKKSLTDGLDHAEVIKRSSLDWTIVRAPMLVDQPIKGKYVTGMVGDDQMTTKISRADIASCILDLLDDKQSYHKMPMASWPSDNKFH
jgi:putative NADH-flavin reductase